MALDPQEAVEFMRQVNDAESENRNRGLQCLRFRYGDQWPQYAVTSRGLDRPQLTINETNTYLKKITNAQRQQRPMGRAQPVDSMADKKVAKVITGLGRHVEVNSDADNAYDIAFDSAATIGWGYWRLRTDYIREDSFDQDIFVDSIDNTFAVYFDPNSKLPDGSDAERGVITDVMQKDDFKKQYPGAQLNNFEAQGTGDSAPDWQTEHDIRLAEFFYIERKKEKLLKLSDGRMMWGDRYRHTKLILDSYGVKVLGERESFKRVVKWCKQTAHDILDEKELPGRWIPVVPVYWTAVTIDGKVIRRGLVEDAMDPQRMLNFWQTAITEALALAPKAKWLMAEGQDEGHENEFKNSNLSSVVPLRYKQTDVEGKEAPPPQRIQPEPPPNGLIEATFMATQNLSRVMGVFDPAVRGGAQHKSDKTLNAEQGQSENTNFDGYDNLTRSIKHSWRIMLSWFPSVYDTERVQRIIGPDGKDKLVTLNQKTQGQDEQGQAIAKVLNDVTVGTYDVVMDTGPGYETLRREGSAAMIAILDTPLGEMVAQTSGDLVMRQQDFPGADEIADRLAAANPLSEVDEESEIPPRVQMQLKAMDAHIKQLEQQLQAAGMEIKFKAGIQQQKDDAAMKRELLKGTVKAHDVNERNLSMQHSTEVKAVTAQNVEEIRALALLLSKHLDTADLEREIAARDREQTAKVNEDASAQA